MMMMTTTMAKTKTKTMVVVEEVVVSTTTNANCYDNNLMANASGNIALTTNHNLFAVRNLLSFNGQKLICTESFIIASKCDDVSMSMMVTCILCVQHSMVQHSTVQHSTAQRSTHKMKKHISSERSLFLSHSPSMEFLNAFAALLCL